MGQFNGGGGDGDGGGGEGEWEMGLPAGADLAPLCQLLIPQGLASAFGISLQSNRTAEDVDLASEETFSSIQNRGGAHAPLRPSETAEVDLAGSNAKKQKTTTTTVDEDSGHDDGKGEAAAAMEEGEGESATGDPVETRTTGSKRQRLVWTPELQRRFLDVVGHLGVQNAVPKTIMQMMNVEGLTRENVASHLQKYRIYIKQKQQNFSDDATSSSPGPGIHGGDGLQQVSYCGQMISSLPVPDLDRLATQGSLHHHHHHHYHHHFHNGKNHGRDSSHLRSYDYGHGGCSGYGSVPDMAQQNGSDEGSRKS